MAGLDKLDENAVRKALHNPNRSLESQAAVDLVLRMARVLEAVDALGATPTATEVSNALKTQ